MCGGSGSAASTAASAAFFEALFGLPERLGGSLVSALGRLPSGITNRTVRRSFQGRRNCCGVDFGPLGVPGRFKIDLGVTEVVSISRIN